MNWLLIDSELRIILVVKILRFTCCKSFWPLCAALPSLCSCVRVLCLVQLEVYSDQLQQRELAFREQQRKMVHHDAMHARELAQLHLRLQLQVIYHNHNHNHSHRHSHSPNDQPQRLCCIIFEYIVLTGRCAGAQLRQAFNATWSKPTPQSGALL